MHPFKSNMKIVKTRSEINSVLLPPKEAGKIVGLVPTMGALHNGHLEIANRALEENDVIIVSIFVNPTQFNDKSDLDKYPRNLEADLLKLQTISKDIIVFAPTVDQMYGEKPVANSYDFKGLDKGMEGEYRPGHFQGVATVVDKLLSVVKPDKAYFGEKDYQQLLIIKSLVEQSDLEVEIVACPIIREKNGLALSSRNARLSKRLKDEASFIYKTLKTAKNKFGTESAASVSEWVNEEFAKHSDFDLEYFVIANAEDLSIADKKVEGNKYRAFVATYAEGVRLIDNVALN